MSFYKNAYDYFMPTKYFVNIDDHKYIFFYVAFRITFDEKKTRSYNVNFDPCGL